MRNQSMTAGGETPHRSKRHLSFSIKFMRIEMFTVLLGIALLLAAVTLYVALASPDSESKQINKSEYQAVFITNTAGASIQSSVYFGKIINLNDKFVTLTNVFYIQAPTQTQSSSSTTNTNLTLLKLGTTELHMPEDKMIINRSAITFWENLKDSSQVVTKIKEYYKNPSSSTTTTTPSTTTPTTTTKPAGQ